MLHLSQTTSVELYLSCWVYGLHHKLNKANYRCEFNKHNAPLKILNCTNSSPEFQHEDSLNMEAWFFKSNAELDRTIQCKITNLQARVNNLIWGK